MPTFPVCRKSVLRAVAALAVLVLFTTSLAALRVRLRERTPQQQCISNLQQLAVALQTYVDDYDSRFPSVGVAGGGLTWTPVGTTWVQRLGPYVKGAPILACPKAGATSDKPYTYLFSRRLSGQSQGSVQHPALCVILGDWIIFSPATGFSGVYSTTWDIARTKQASPAGSWQSGERHAGAGTLAGGAVYVFVDGHAKLLRRPDILLSNTVTPPPGIDAKPSFYP